MRDGITAVFDVGALRNNLGLIRQTVGENRELIACVKANAYGHGVEAIAHCLEQQGVRWLSVATIADAMKIRRAGVASRVLLFPIIGERPNRALCEAGITISIQSYREAEEIARDVSGMTSVFLKIDSGLGRLGASTADAPQIVQRIVSTLPSIRLEGVFTHLPFSDPQAIPWIEDRLREFDKCVVQIRSIVGSPLLAQALASSGIVFGLHTPETNAVSPGELLFGLEPPVAIVAPGKTSSFGSHPVLKEVRTLLGAIHEIAARTRYGFGGALVAEETRRLGVVPVGFSNSLLVPRAGQAANVLGRIVPIVAVSLEHAVLDITDVQGVSDGCPVILLSRDPRHNLSLAEVARRQNRLPIEVLVSLTGKCTCDYIEAGTPIQESATTLQFTGESSRDV